MGSIDHIQGCGFLALVEYFYRKLFYVLAINTKIVLMFVVKILL